MVIFGTRYFGYCDKVYSPDGSEVGQVATMFVHVMFVPLIPLQSWFLLGDERGVKISMSLKSVLVAWVRSFLFWSALFMVVSAVGTWGCTCFFALPLAIGYFAMPSITGDASPERADTLLAETGLNRY